MFASIGQSNTPDNICLNKKISDEKGVIFSLEIPGSACFTSNIDPSVAPEGKQLFTVFKSVVSEELYNEEKKEELIADLKDKVFEMFPDMKDAIEDGSRVIPMPRGIGAELNTKQHRYKRPGIEVPGIENLYLIGDTCNAPGKGGDIPFLSAMKLTEMLEKEI